MNRWKRIIFYLLINIAVSACTVLLVFTAWERYYRPPLETAPPVVVAPAATATPPAPTTEAPPATPTLALQTYQVQPGDTLSGIAAQFDVTLNEILLVNPLTDPDSLDVGDVILIPRAAPTEVANPTIPAATRVPPPTSTPGPSPTALPPGQASQVEIVSVVGAGTLADERVVLKYNGEGDLSLASWRLEDTAGNAYIFPQLTLFKGGAITVFTKAGPDTVVELYWGLNKSVWASGEIVSLIDPQGQVQATYRVP